LWPKNKKYFPHHHIFYGLAVPGQFQRPLPNDCDPAQENDPRVFFAPWGGLENIASECDQIPFTDIPLLLF
jgi:hypothetical protein